LSHNYFFLLPLEAEMVPTQQFELHGEQFNSGVLDILGSKEWLDDECIRLVFVKYTESKGQQQVDADGDQVEYLFVNP
jgi:hypothetical protein